MCRAIVWPIPTVSNVLTSPIARSVRWDSILHSVRLHLTALDAHPPSLTAWTARSSQLLIPVSNVQSGTMHQALPVQHALLTACHAIAPTTVQIAPQTHTSPQLAPVWPVPLHASHV